MLQRSPAPWSTERHRDLTLPPPGMKPGEVIDRMDATPAAVEDRLALRSYANGDLVVRLVRGKPATRCITLYVGCVYRAELIAKPSLPGGFGPAGEVKAAGQ